MWGWNETGQLGLSVNHDDIDDDRQAAASGKVPCQTFPVPVDLPGDLDVMTVSCGSRHTAAIAGTSSKFHVHFFSFSMCVVERNNHGLDPWGAFHSTQNSGNFGWYIKWNGPFRFGPTGIFGTSFEGGPL